MRIVFIGPPGAGKGTQAAQLAEHLQLPHLSTGEMFRLACQQQTEVGRQAATYMDAGQLVPDEIVQRIVCQRLQEPDCRAGFILDGFPRTESQAANLDCWLEKQQQSLAAVIDIEVTEQELFRRLAARGRADDDREVVQQRLQHHYKLTHPLLDYYRNRGILQVIDGLGTAEEVFARIRQAIDPSWPREVAALD